MVDGGGEANQSDNTCACVVGGGGEYTNGDCRCACVISGVGDGARYVSISDLF